jgi:type I restriction enzyme M protein
MLDTQTKRRIDDCRDILVGKLPDPKAQIEQITIGLIYKFMDDMDKEAVELGGKAKFFSDYKVPDPEFPNDQSKDKVVEFSKYAWDKLLHPKVTAAEMLTLYAEAIVGMEKNPNIPQLFRDIFKNAFLPYRDPETLKLFLKTISEFEYTHSEKLGDAFEYLLSVMGSQGDAGQFRTPRHIIDFLVAIVDPDKNNTVLDPACGTAGFLISAYKHILLKYSKENKEGLNIFQYNQLEKKPFNNLGDQLTPDDRKKLIQNFVGYDISPDMVRLSLVNLYLHNFNTPNIHEYDTLSSEERWNETSDVVLANPPFMSPKGGIRPHKKFTITSSRSEVLFVDYIAEHLNQKGKSGIIVPEGIIFQSGKSYKELRKMLVENYLYAVVSLPAGVFNPYSGVKTSILLMDKEVSKKQSEILFVKIENDGYNLGSQRNAVKGSQLVEAINLAHEFVKTGEISETEIAYSVKKEEISKNGDYILSGEKYKISELRKSSDFDLVSLNEVCEILNGYAFKSSLYSDSGIRVLRITNVQKGEIVDNDPKFYPKSSLNKINNYLLCENDILMSLTGNVGRVGRLPKELLPAALNQRVACLRPKKTLLNKYLFYILNQDFFENDCIDSSNGIAQKNLSTVWLSNYKIPLPPLSIQEKIVKELDSYQKIINGAKTIVSNYIPNFEITSNWEMVELGELCTINGELVRDINLNLPYIGADSIESNTGILLKKESCESQGVNGPVYKFNGINVLYSKIRPYLNKVTLTNFEGYCSSDMYPIISNERLNIKFLFYFLLSDYFNFSIKGFYERASIPKINRKQLFSVKIPLPSIETQLQIVAQIEREQKLILANKQLIEIFEQKIKNKISKFWGE